MADREVLEGRLVLPDGVVPGRLTIEDGWILDLDVDLQEERALEGPIYAPGFIDVHVHGWGGFAATGDADDLGGMARALLRHGVTSFLPTAPTLAEDELPRFAGRVRDWMPGAPEDGADPLGFNLEGPLLAQERRGAHDPELLRVPAALAPGTLDALLDGLRVITIAPELAGAGELIARLAAADVVVSLGHSAATLVEARAGYGAGARSTTHLFNAMSGVDHRSPGLAVAALEDDGVFVELIADGHHVHSALWPLVARVKPVDRLLAVSDALPVAGMGDGRSMLGTLEIEVHDGLARVAGTATLAGSVIALDTAVRNLVANGVGLVAAVRAAATNPAELLGADDRGSLEEGRRAHIVELDDELGVRRVTRGAGWIEA